MDAVPPCGVRGGLDDTALVAPATHDQQGHRAQLGMALSADLDEKRVEVHVENAGAHAIFDAPTDRSPRL
jgi:hypothetical protein